MGAQEIVSLIREFGFPTFFCLYLMYMNFRRERSTEMTMREVVVVLNKMNENMDDLESGVKEVKEGLSGGIRVGISSQPVGHSSSPLGSGDASDTLRLPAPPKKAGT